VALSGVTHNPNAQIELGRVLQHLFQLNALRQRPAEDHIKSMALMTAEQFSDIKRTLCQPKALTDSTRDCLLLLLSFRMVVALSVRIHFGFMDRVFSWPLASRKAYWLIWSNSVGDPEALETWREDIITGKKKLTNNRKKFWCSEPIGTFFRSSLQRSSV